MKRDGEDGSSGLPPGAPRDGSRAGAPGEGDRQDNADRRAGAGAARASASDPAHRRAAGRGFDHAAHARESEPRRLHAEPALDAVLLTALDAAGELMLVRGHSGRVLYVNAAFLKAFGGERTDWVGRWFSVAPPVSTADQRRYEMLMRTRSGPLWIEWDERLLPDDGGVISVGRDVTRRREAHDDLEASQRAKSLFFAAVTHELRTPLAGALGVARLLEATPLRPDQADFVRLPHRLIMRWRWWTIFSICRASRPASSTCVPNRSMWPSWCAKLSNSPRRGPGKRASRSGSCRPPERRCVSSATPRACARSCSI
jgi:PAS domain-containing protein